MNSMLHRNTGKRRVFRLFPSGKKDFRNLPAGRNACEPDVVAMAGVDGFPAEFPGRFT